MEKMSEQFSVEINEIIVKIENLEVHNDDGSLEYINSLIELGHKLRAFANAENYSTCFTKAIFYLNKADEKCDNILKAKTTLEREKIVIAKAECSKCISIIYTAWGHSEMAIMYATNVINILEDEFGVNSVKVRTGYENINSVLAYFAKQKEAIDFAIKHLNLCKKVFGEHSLEVSKQLTGIGHIYRSMNDFEKCAEYFKKALQICESVLAPTDVEVAHCYYNVGYVCADTGEVADSVNNYKKALEIYKIALGEDSEEVIDTLQAIAYQSVRINELTEAENCFNIALKTLLNKYGENSKKLIPLYCNIAVFYNKQRNYKKEIEVYTKAEYSIRESGLFKEYDLFYIKSQLGYAYINNHKYQLGKECLEDALKIGKEHYNINKEVEIELLESIYYCMVTLDETVSECVNYLGAIINLKEKIYGEETSETDFNKYALGLLYFENNKNQKSLQCFEELLTTLNSRDELNKNLVVEVYNKIAELYFKDNNHEKCFECLEKSLTMAKKFKEQDKLVVENIYTTIGEKYYELGEKEKALECFDNAIKHKVKNEGELSHNLYILNSKIANYFIEKENKELGKKYLFDANNIYMKLYKALPYENLSLMCDYGLLFLNKDEYLEAVNILEVFLKSNSQNIYYSKYYGQVLRLLDYLETKFQVSANAFGREVLLKQMALFAEKRLELLELADDKNYDEIAECCCTIGYAYFELRDSAKVLEYGLKEYEILKEHLSDDTSRIASALVNIGCAYEEESTYEANLKCLDYNTQAFKLDQTSELISSNIAGFYVETENFELAEKFMQLALISAEEKGVNYEYKVAEMESNYTNVYVEWYNKNKSEAHFNNAVKHFENSLRLYEKLSIKGQLNIENCFNHELAGLHVYIGKLYLEKGYEKRSVEDLNVALDYLNKAKEYYGNVYDENNIDLVNMYNCFGKAYIYRGFIIESTNDYKLALELLEKSLHIQKKEYGEKHPKVLETYGLLGAGHFKKAAIRDKDCNFDKVIEYGNLGLHGTVVHYGKDSFRLIEVYYFLSEVYKSVGNYQLSNSMTKEMNRIKNLNV